ncbi:MAG: MFS transporter [Candidatus Helarchaeota archaeon]|nr:MFS transporter [Candidatus Helarchaeota archaeon]
MSEDKGVEIEAKEWTRYHTYLVSFFSIMNFFGLFNIVFGGFVLNEVAQSFGVSVTIIPIISSIAGIGLFFSIITRTLPDHFGRKRVLFILSLLAYTNLIIHVLAPNIIIYTIIGFTGSILGTNTANVIISEEIPADYRGTAVGIMQGIGMTAAPFSAFISIFAGGLDTWRYIYLIMNIPAIIIFTILWLWLREPERYIQDKKLRDERGEENPSIFAVFQRKYLKTFFMSSLLLFLTQFIYLTIKRYFKPFLVDERGFDNGTVGLWMIFIYIGSILGYYLSGYLADRLGRRRSIYITATSYFIFSITFVISRTRWVIFLSFFGLNLSFSIFMIVATIYSFEFYSTKERSTGSGWVQVLGNSAWVFANLVISIFVYSLKFSWGETFLILCFLPILMIILTYFMPETKALELEIIVEKFVEKK